MKILNRKSEWSRADRCEECLTHFPSYDGPILIEAISNESWTMKHKAEINLRVAEWEAPSAEKGKHRDCRIQWKAIVISYMIIFAWFIWAGELTQIKKAFLWI